MELEVSQKVRAAIKAKLVELGVHVDEELPDYIMVLIANRRTPPQMESDLNLFLGDQTHRFVSWLSLVLKKLEEVTAQAGGSGGSATTVAVETAPAATKKRKSDVVVDATVAKEDSKKKRDDEGGEIAFVAKDTKKKEKLAPPKEPSPSPKKEEEKQKKSPEAPSSSSSHHHHHRPEIKSPRQQQQQQNPTRRRQDSKGSISPPQKRRPSPQQQRRRSRSRSPIRTARHDSYVPRTTVFQRLLNRGRRGASPKDYGRGRRGSSPQQHDMRRRGSPQHQQERGNRSATPPSPRQPRRTLSSIVVKKNIEEIIKSNEVKKVASAVVKISASGSKSRGSFVEKPSNLLLKAVSEANKDVFSLGGGRDGDGHERVNVEKKIERKLMEGDDVGAVSSKRRSVLERLGKRVVVNEYAAKQQTQQRKSVHERLGNKKVMMGYDGDGDDFAIENIVVRIDDDGDRVGDDGDDDGDVFVTQSPYQPQRAKAPTATAAVSSSSADDELPIPRISIAVNDDDTSDDDEEEEEDDDDDNASKSGDGDEEKGTEAKKTESGDDGDTPKRDDEDDDDETDVLELQPQDSPINNAADEVAVAPVPEKKKLTMETTDLREKLVKRSIKKKAEAAKNDDGDEEEKQKQQKSAAVTTATAAATATIPPPTVRINPIRHYSTAPVPIPSPILNLHHNQQQQETTTCKFWPNCTYKNACIYTHPICKFNPCTNLNCAYKHSSGQQQQQKSLKPSPSQPICKFFPKCHNLECKFYHPTPCRFGLGCKDKNCKYFHPGGKVFGGGVGGGSNVLPLRSSLKWEKK